MSYDWEESKSSNKGSRFTCLKCYRNENHGALFNYHTHGVKSPFEGTLKLPMYCTECVDTIKREADIPYYLVSNFMCASDTFEFYRKRVEKKGGEHESLQEQKTVILREYLKLVEQALQKQKEEDLDMLAFGNICKKNAETLISWIAQVGDVSYGSISDKLASPIKKVE
jgi:hypothetical protein